METAAHTAFGRFRQVIRAWYRSTHRDRQRALNQIANLTWRNGNSTHTGYVSRLVQHPMYRDFFTVDWISAGNVGRARVNWETVTEFYPSLVGQRLKGGVFTIMDLALEQEASAIKQRPRGPSVKVFAGEYLASAQDGDRSELIEFSYRTRDPEDDAPFPFMEGLPIVVKHKDGRPFYGKLQAVDEEASKLIVRYETGGSILGGDLRERKEAFIKVKRETLTRLRQFDGPYRRLLEAQPMRPRQVTEFKVTRESLLDDSQRAAVDFSGRHDISVIWGPPGTGKTHSVGELIAHRAHAGKRILVVAVANVAVDQVALAAVRAMERHGWGSELSGGVFLRHGFARDPAVNAESRLFPQRAEVRRFRRKLEDARRRLDEAKHDRRARARARGDIEDAQKNLANVTRKAIDRAKVVFTTVHQTATKSSFPEFGSFDMVVLDEASMMSITDAVIAAGHAREQIAISGDVHQLGPIAVASSDAAHRSLHRDILTHLKVDASEPPPVVRMLLHQRRMHPDISALVNQRFYQGRLKDSAAPDQLQAVDFAPAPGSGAWVVTVDDVEDALVERTASQSRMNRGSARVCATLAARYAKTGTVGIISPYASQVHRLKSYLAIVSDDTVRKRIQVGTIHAFQGSERDVIIWDLVETMELELGRLFRDITGRRLVNVAITRAKGKLLLVGRPGAFHSARSGSAVCLPLAQILFGNRDLNQKKTSWSKLKKELNLTELVPAKERAKPTPAPSAASPRAPGRTKRRIVRPKRRGSR